MPVETIIEEQSSLDDDRTLTNSGFFWRERDGVRVLVSSALEKAGFANGFSTRLGGVSLLPHGDLNLSGFDDDTRENINENRRRFLAVFPGSYRLSTRWQVHGTAISVIDSPEGVASTEEKADGLISDSKNLLLGVKTADCVPVLIGDPVTKSYAAIHAGWRGTVESIVARAVENLRRVYSAKPEDMIAAIGPAAACQSYEVGSDVIDSFEQNFADSQKYFRPTREGHALVDLHAANCDQLVAAGVADANIFTAPFCTIERNDLFFSYRLESRTRAKTGRLMSVIGRARLD